MGFISRLTPEGLENCLAMSSMEGIGLYEGGSEDYIYFPLRLYIILLYY